MLAANLLELCPLRLGEIQLTKRDAERAGAEPIAPAAPTWSAARTLRECDS
jgi:hypothetical protein